MVALVQLVAIILGLLLVGATVGLFEHAILTHPRLRCPRCGSRRVRRAKDPHAVLTCRQCGNEFRANLET